MRSHELMRDSISSRSSRSSRSNRSGGGAKFSSSFNTRRRSTRSIQDTSGRGQVLIDTRESHTADLDSFDHYMILLEKKNPAFDRKLWTYFRSLLEKYGCSTGFEPCLTQEFLPKTLEDSAKFKSKIAGLNPINPINPRKIAKLLPEVPVETIVTELLHATEVGLTTMRFSPICVRCGGQCTRTVDLSTYNAEKKIVCCAMCGAENNIQSLDSIGAFFFFNPSVLYILATNWGCYPSKENRQKRICTAPVPGNDLQMGITYSIGCRVETDLSSEPLPPGDYRGRCGISGANFILQVEGDPANDEDIHECNIRVSQLLIQGSNCNSFGIDCSTSGAVSLPKVKVPHGRLKFNIRPDSDSLFVFILHHLNTPEEVIVSLPTEERDAYTSASDIIHHPLHQDQQVSFKSVLKLGGNLDVGQVTLVFTDVVKSTEMYGRLGDWKALEIVQQHFQILFQAFSTWGRVVKTVGDAVMAAFASPAAAMRAAAEALLGIQESLPDLQIRIGIHSGPALLVPVNGINDYFGQTVNRAARLEGQAPPGGCLVSTEAMDEKVLGEILSEVEFDKVEPINLCLKGIGATTQAMGFQLKTR